MTDASERGHIPAWVDMNRLCREICSCPSSVDILVRDRKLPPPKRLRGKLLWRWKDVDAWLEAEGPPGEQSDSLEARITASARQVIERRRA